MPASTPGVISDTSPLQYLFQLDLLELLPRLYGEVRIPQAVVAELAAGRARGVSLPDPATCDWIITAEVAGPSPLPILPDLGAGEREAVALALQAGDVLLLVDDLTARRFANVLGVRTTGTLGVLLAAKDTGILQQVRPLLDRLVSLGFRLSPSVRTEVLKLAGEAG